MRYWPDLINNLLSGVLLYIQGYTGQYLINNLPSAVLLYIQGYTGQYLINNLPSGVPCITLNVQQDSWWEIVDEVLTCVTLNV
jgi:hypothetical protein